MGFCLQQQEMKVKCMKFLNQDTLSQNSALYTCVSALGTVGNVI
jgi:hypothetical protein